MRGLPGEEGGARDALSGESEDGMIPKDIKDVVIRNDNWLFKFMFPEHRMSQDNEPLEDAMDREGSSGGVVDDEPGDSSIVRQMKVFVWDSFDPGLSSSGLAFAVAETVEQAREMILKKYSEENYPSGRMDHYLDAEPEVHAFPYADYESGAS